MDLMLVLPLLLLVVMMIFMWRSNKKRQEQQQEMRQQLVPGTEVMTQAGIYGTIVDVDADNNVATIESAPGTQLRVHSATIVNVVTPTVPDDASALTGDEPVIDEPSYDTESKLHAEPNATDVDSTDDDTDGRSKL